MEQFFSRLAKPVGWLSLVLAAASTWAILFYAPVEKVQGVVQKIMYIHVPSAIIGYLAFTVCAIFSGFFLWKGRRHFDLIGQSSAELGVLLLTLVLLTGPIWAKPIWGAWWVWDARLTSTLLLWLIYLGYFVLRRLVPGEQGARFSSILAIVGILDIPFINMAAEKFKTLHPPNLMKGGMTPEMGSTLALCAFTMIVFYIYLLAKRVELAFLEDRAAARAAQAAEQD